MRDTGIHNRGDLLSDTHNHRFVFSYSVGFYCEVCGMGKKENFSDDLYINFFFTSDTV
jgi:hypothetical protein